MITTGLKSNGLLNVSLRVRSLVSSEIACVANSSHLVNHEIRCGLCAVHCGAARGQIVLLIFLFFFS